MSDAPALEAGSDPRREAMATRAVLPLALPVLSAIAVALWVLNISRAFIAGGKTGALVIVLIVTVGIMAGAAIASAAPRLQSSTLTVMPSRRARLIWRRWLDLVADHSSSAVCVRSTATV